MSDQPALVDQPTQQHVAHNSAHYEDGVSRKRFALKVAGASGQGINTIGEIIAKALKRSGFSVFAYREYPSLIKGGHATYQIDFSPQPISSSTQLVDIAVVINRQKTNWHLPEIKPGGLILHDIPNPRINATEADYARKQDFKFAFIPALELAAKVGGNDLVSNIVTTGWIWKILGLDYETIAQVVREVFAAKPKYLELDLKCLQAGFDYEDPQLPPFARRLPKPGEVSEQEKTSLHTTQKITFHELKAIAQVPSYQNHLLITGNESLGLGAVAAGARIYYSYPMTPTSTLLSFLSEIATSTGMIVKQAEDEITAAAMVIGSMHAGSRAFTGTSGGGFDLMTEHISLAAMIETPFVCVLGQRPGPATGLPTWTTQSDLHLATFSGHGEFSRCVMTIRDAESAYDDIQHAFNIADRYQIPVILLTDKLIAETNYTIRDVTQKVLDIDRGELIQEQERLNELLPGDRYKLTGDGISPRWLPGAKAADYNANSDEHDEEGNVTEEAEMSMSMAAKRLRKQNALADKLPEPELFYNEVDLMEARGKLRLIGWGSTYGAVQDVMSYFETQKIKVDYLDVKYLWPLKTETIKNYLLNDQPPVLIEGNHNAQLGQLIRMQTGIDIERRVLKYDGRPFFYEELISALSKYY